MIILFSDSDLISFGQYIVSEERLGKITEKLGTANSYAVNNRLLEITGEDVQDWISITQKLENDSEMREQFN